MAIEDAIELTHSLQNTDNIMLALRNYESKRYSRVYSVVKDSRRLGVIAQWKNPWLIGIRDLHYSYFAGAWIFKSIFKKYARWTPPTLLSNSLMSGNTNFINK